MSKPSKESDNNERVENEPEPSNISTEDDQDLGLDLSDDEESDKLADEKRRSFDQDKKVYKTFPFVPAAKFCLVPKFKPS